MQLGSERLGVAGYFVLCDVEALIAGNTVMKRRGCHIKLNWSIGDNFWLFPAIILGPVDRKHVICIRPSENKFILIWLVLFRFSLNKFNI